LHADPKFKEVSYIINDFSEITGHSLQTTHTKVYALTDELISATREELEIALVVTQDSHIALAENFRKLMSGSRIECEIIQTVEAARKWAS